VPWETDVTVACAGVTIQPGDILVGDADGVVVLPPPLAAEVLADALEQERQEQFIAAQVAVGEPIDGLFPLTDRWRPAYEAWLKQHEPHESPTPPPSEQAQPQQCKDVTIITATTSHRCDPSDPSHATTGTGDTAGN
ncbi:MAG: hypothetical protein ACRDPY_32140, partial [Streptosporangiaceae bacterium]